MGDISLIESFNDVMLVYDTRKKSWEVWSGWTDPTTFSYLKRFRTDNRNQQRNTLFWGASTKIYRAFENRHTEENASGVTTTRGTDVFSDLFSDTGTPIVFDVLTKPYDLGLPNYRKQFGYLKVFSERPGIHISALIDDKDRIPLGLITKQVQRFKFPAEARGYRCALLLDESSTNPSVIYNGHIFEDTTTIDKN